jgi:hypothetical protein
MRGGHGGLPWRFQITYAKLQVRQVHQLLLLLHASVHEIKEGTRHYMHMHYTLLGLPLITKALLFFPFLFSLLFHVFFSDMTSPYLALHVA